MSDDEDRHVPAHDYPIKSDKAHDAYQCHFRLSFIDIPQYKSTQEGADYFNNKKALLADKALQEWISFSSESTGNQELGYQPVDNDKGNHVD